MTNYIADIEGFALSLPEYLAFRSIDGIWTDGFAKDFDQFFKVPIQGVLSAKGGDPVALDEALQQSLKSWVPDAIPDEVQPDAGRTGPRAGRSRESQSWVSKAGNNWERLVTWYLSAASFGSNTYVVHKKKRSAVVPSSVSDALKITVQNTELASDNDILLLTLSDECIESAIPLVRPERFVNKRLEEAVLQVSHRQVSVVSVSCKSNFNDQIAISLFWHNLYDDWLQTRPGERRDRLQHSIGTANYRLDDINGFAVAFVTAPTNQYEELRADRAQVIKATMFRGGAYWCIESRDYPFMQKLSQLFVRNNIDIRIGDNSNGDRWRKFREHLADHGIDDPWHLIER